jgi:iron(III) transport system permease protein
MARRVLFPFAVLVALLWPLGVFFASSPDLGDLAAAPYGRSLSLGLLTATGTLLLGLPAAWALAGTGGASRWLRAAALAVLLIPPYLAASAWLGISGRCGFLALSEQALAFMPGASDAFMDGGNMLLCALVLVLALWPCVALPAAASLAALGRECREAALLARGRWACFRHVELPVALPAGIVGAIAAFALSLAELGAPDLFAFTTAARDILKGFEAHYDYSQAAGRALPLLGVAGALGVALVMLAGRYRLAELARTRHRGLPAPTWSSVYAALLSLLSLGAVLGGLALNAGSCGVILGAANQQLGLVARSLLVAGLAAVFAVLLCSVLLGVVRLKRGWVLYAGALGVLSLTLILPGTLWGLGLLRAREVLDSGGLLGRAASRFLDSPAVLVWAATARAMLGVGIVLGWGYRRLSPEMLEAGRTAGLSAARRWWLTAGLMRRYVIAALFLGTALALGELGATVMIAPPGWETLSVGVFKAMHSYHGDVTAALALITTAGAALFALIGAALAGRRQTPC